MDAPELDEKLFEAVRCAIIDYLVFGTPAEINSVCRITAASMTTEVLRAIDHAGYVITPKPPPAPQWPWVRNPIEGKPCPDTGLVHHYVPGIMEPIVALPGTLFEDTAVLGQLTKKRYVCVVNGRETVVAEFLQHT